MSQEVKKPQIGDVIAGYTILSKLGSGGMGDVYLCDDKSLSRRVAVKIMHAFDPSLDAEAGARFILEGKSLAKLKHPNIVSVYGLGEDKGFLYIAMEHVAGRSLHYLSRERRLTPREMISIFADIAAGLDHAHSQGIVHRDVKPANILVDAFGRAKIIDFGIAKSIGGNLQGAEGVQTKTGAVIGTLNYIAPELFRGDPPAPSTDIYALGLLLYEMLTGRTPFKGESQFATMEMIRAGQLDIPENLHLVLPEETWSILYEMIHKEPLRRPQTCTAAADRLKQIKFPNLPAYFNADLLSVKIANVKELHERLHELAVDPAEWPFVLSLAVRIQSDKPKPTSPQNQEGESTKLIESTDFVVPVEVLDEALGHYRQDLDTILTMRKAEQLSALTPPPVSLPIDVKEHVQGPKGLESRPVLETANQVAAANAKQSRTFEFAVVGVLVVALGFLVWQKMNAQKTIEVVNAAPQKRRGGVAVEAPKSIGKVATGSVTSVNPSSFAMVVEPPSDAWPPVAFRMPQVGEVFNWKWKRRVSDGVNDLGTKEFFEVSTYEGTDEGLLKFKVERTHREGGREISMPAGSEWYLPGFLALPSKALRSLELGSLTSQTVGQPQAVFPLRKGKEVQFSVTYNRRAEADLKPEIPLEQAYRATCSIRDQVDLTTSLGPAKVVKIDCSLKSDKTELAETIYWNIEKGFAVRRDRRFAATVNGRPLEMITVGELQNEPNAHAAQAHELRQPAAKQ